MPKRGIAVAGHCHDLSRFTQKVEGHEDEYQGEQHGKASRQEQLHHVEGEPARGKEAYVDHASAGACRVFGSNPRAIFVPLAKKRSSAPIGWPPGLCAST